MRSVKDMNILPCCYYYPLKPHLKSHQQQCYSKGEIEFHKFFFEVLFW
jgi:hypothetical protein